MTALEAKELSLEVWRYLAEHPEIYYKNHLPYYLRRKIINCACKCPLCDLFFVPGADCPKCPLKSCNDTNPSPYSSWLLGSKTQRQAAAQEIVRLVEAWEPEEET